MAVAGGIATGVALDAIFGDPSTMHPVAGFGRFAGWLERRMYADSRAAGARFVTVAVGVPVAAAAVADLAARRRPLVRAAMVAAGTWAVLGGTSLRAEARTMAGSLLSGDLAAARARLPHLCGREPSTLDEKELTRATVESVAENTSDAVVAPLVWGAIGGLPGLVGYRAVNTLDAMVGSRSERYARFGTAAARLDDLANMAPARLTAGLTVLAAPVVGGSPRRTLRVWQRDGASHPSPNSGHCEAAAAGAMDVRLGGRNRYAGRVEDRPSIGDGPRPGIADIERVARLSAVVGLAAAGLAVAVAAGRSARAGRKGASR
jgi:adenosylcobinamide-phosphate synthase